MNHLSLFSILTVGLVAATQNATQSVDKKKPNLKGWAKSLILLVPTAGFELAT
jgi:hypothetical protein